MFANKPESDAFCTKLFVGSQIRKCKKQFYFVHVRRLSAKEIVPTEENRVPGQVGHVGEWVITRYEADGTKQLADDGLVNQWVNTEKDMVKTYVVPPEVLKFGYGFVPTRLGVEVYMVKLDAPLTIVTGWGTADAKADGWLACYDYDAATGVPGIDFNVVSSTYWKRSYEFA